MAEQTRDHLPSLSRSTCTPNNPLPFDVASSLVRLGGDEELFRKLVEFFLEDAPPLVTQIHEGLRTGAATLVERGAHSLKGLAGNLSGTDMVQAAYAVEECGRAGDLPAANQALPELEVQLDRLRAALKIYLAACS